MPEQNAPTRTERAAPARAGSRQAEARAEAESRLTVELATALSRARRRALRDGDKQIDTAHLLHSLLEADPEVRAAFDSNERTTRVLGYLVQRSIGYGLRWHGTVEDSGILPVVRGRALNGWSPQAVIAMRGALERAALRGDPRACGLDLLAALASDRECRAVDVLVRAGVDAESLAGRLSRQL
ncbi:Clp protease N-terminal domain-containing protein [Streptomyces sp. GMY02]|uniref:Clp protease N-terminal domain-containing protein n=1 Tax=Streptomyces sp. GMY02 TaxID=1333528 RepID=UPI0020B7B2A4|nr:Clp protease N-terminal domain-containing protein [Streptomyces sp. GMY02]